MTRLIHPHIIPKYYPNPSVGKYYAAIYCNDDGLEASAIVAGKVTGDLVFPIPYCPEFYKREFKSEVADMKNSVACRMNAQASCAAQFIGNHLEVSYLYHSDYYYSFSLHSLSPDIQLFSPFRYIFPL